MQKLCKKCQQPVSRLSQDYCSNQCQRDHEYDVYIDKWKRGLETGVRGKTLNVSNHIRRYMVEKHGEKCSVCGWAARNPVTGKVPVELDHRDGDASNNAEENLRLLCPNDHALTPNFRRLNKISKRQRSSVARAPAL